jgi:hypothetical protein
LQHTHLHFPIYPTTLSTHTSSLTPSRQQSQRTHTQSHFPNSPAPIATHTFSFPPQFSGTNCNAHNSHPQQYYTKAVSIDGLYR